MRVAHRGRGAAWRYGEPLRRQSRSGAAGPVGRIRGNRRHGRRRAPLTPPSPPAASGYGGLCGAPRARFRPGAGCENLQAIAHDLRNPLTVIQATAQLLAMTSQDPAAGAALGQIMAASGSMRRILDRLSRMALAEAARHRQALEPVEVGSLVRGYRERMVGISGDRLVIGGGGPVAWGYLDPSVVEQVLDNLVSNALKFSPPSAPVILAWRLQPPGAVAVSVVDRGPGVPPAEQRRIFDPYYRCRASAPPGSDQAGPGGAGLGLHISRRLVEGQGGRIWVENNPEGGATFTFCLPMRAADPSPAGGA